MPFVSYDSQFIQRNSLFSLSINNLYSFSCFAFPTVVGKSDRDIWELVVQDDLVSIFFF